jgi:hypothetical protein
MTQENLQLEPLMTIDVPWDLKPPFKPCGFVFIIDDLCGSFLATFGRVMRARYRPLVDQVQMSLRIISSRSSIRTRKGGLGYLTSRTLAHATPENVVPKSIATAILRSCKESVLNWPKSDMLGTRCENLKKRHKTNPGGITFEEDNNWRRT